MTSEQRCDFCARLAVEQCAAPDCRHRMCELHTSRKVLPAFSSLPQATDREEQAAYTYCPEHAAEAGELFED